MGDETKVGDNLDLSRRGDNVILGTAIRNRWPIPDRLKQMAITATEAIIESSDDGRVINGAVANLLRAEAQNQADQQEANRNARLDSGKATENIVYEVRIPGPIELGDDPG